MDKKNIFWALKKFWTKRRYFGHSKYFGQKGANFGQKNNYPFIFSPLYRQYHFSLADGPGTAQCHYLTQIDKFIDKFIHLLIIYYSLAKN